MPAPIPPENDECENSVWLISARHAFFFALCRELVPEAWLSSYFLAYATHLCFQKPSPGGDIFFSYRSFNEDVSYPTPCDTAQVNALPGLLQTTLRYGAPLEKNSYALCRVRSTTPTKARLKPPRRLFLHTASTPEVPFPSPT